MGLTNSPAAFKGMMHRIFYDLLDVCVIIYLDDVVIFSRSAKQHLLDLEKVFTKLEEHKLHVKESKCSFFQSKIEFCGHCASGEGISISSEKSMAMAMAPVIKNAQDLRSYIGSCVWFHSFIVDYAEITAPLSKLLKNETPWEWGNAQEEALKLLRHLITTAPVLRYFSPKLETRVYTDASNFAIGGWIEQRHGDVWHPCTFWSRKMNGAELNYSVHEKELLALVEMCDKHSYWLRGVNFVVNTDHKSLIYLRDAGLHFSLIYFRSALIRFRIKREKAIQYDGKTYYNPALRWW
jgi:RNase H-like domain found in reverse transcriptase/Reverse transcriptase (RNA-dependent DNA polymerase)